MLRQTKATPVPTHAENRETRRLRLLNEARRLYAEKGVENTTMQDVAAAAGCTRRTLYAYFESWEDLVLQAYIEDMGKRWESQKKAMADGENGLDRLNLWARAYYAYGVEHPESVHLEMFRDYRGIEPTDLRPPVKERYDAILTPLLGEMVAVFSKGQQDGSIRPELAPLPTLNQFAFSLRTLMNRILCSGDNPDEFDTTDFVTNFIQLFLRGIANHPEAGS